MSLDRNAKHFNVFNSLQLECGAVRPVPIRHIDTVLFKYGILLLFHDNK